MFKKEWTYPSLPYPQRVQKVTELEFHGFLGVFHKLHINIPFTETLEQMAIYAKFLKEILSKKKWLGESDTIALSEKSSIILQKYFTLKLKNPDSFTICYSIGKTIEGKSLCDFGIGINFMSYLVFKYLGL